MGTSDGWVVGATKLVDHGSSTDRLDIVLVAEGFTQNEQSLFAAKANEFAEALFDHSPFSALDAELAINVWRLDVVSAESGLDDPVDCEGGTGDAPATYFDASRCADGIPRAISVDEALVTSTVDAFVPFWDTILVIVNSDLVAGKTLGPMAIFTTWAGWIDTALHEYGHMGFGLADEYDYLMGCMYDEPDFYHYDGPEPGGPNVTANSDLAAIKWAGWVSPTATVVLNPDCTKCGPEVSPLPAGTIGAFEGAYHYHCGVFRPAFTCRMRDSTEFCPVCESWIREVLSTYSGFETWPGDSETDANPWPTTLAWTPGESESAWQLQITDQPDFTHARPYVTAKTTVQNGQMVAYHTMTLKPDTEYRWRVRKVTGTGAAWTQERMFTTAANQVTLVKPRSFGDSGAHYPWGLEFEWKEVDGADHYEIEVTQGPNKIFPDVEVFGTTHRTLDVKVKASLQWRARAIPPAGQYFAGVWSDPFPLLTTWPHVTIHSPDDGDPVYPWPVPLRWNEVQGAVRYKVELERRKDQWGHESYNKPLEFAKSTLELEWPTTQVDLNLRPRFFADNETHTWRVRVWGPPPLNEEGQDSGLYTFVNNGDETIPALIDCADSPGSSGPDGIHWMGANGVVAVSWKDVTKAEAYTLQFMNFGDNTTDPDGIAWKDKVLHQQQSGYVIFDGEALQPKPSVGVTGYWWKATAIGPEGLPGLDDGTPGRRCYVLPDAPQLLEPPQATIDDPGDYGNIAFRFTSAYTPSGEYHVLAVWGPPVGGATPIISGNPGGISQFGPSTLGLSGLKPSTAYQWDVRAHSDIPDSAGGVNWAYPRSEMRLYVTKPPQPPPPQTPWVWDWFFAGSAGLLMCVFGVVPDADTYQIEAQQVVGSVDANSPDWYVTLGALQPFTFHVPELESYTEDVNQWLLANDPTGPALPPSVYAAGLDNTQAGLSYRWHVKACAGNICSPYSQWAKWHEFFPWPF